MKWVTILVVLTVAMAGCAGVNEKVDAGKEKVADAKAAVEESKRAVAKENWDYTAKGCTGIEINYAIHEKVARGLIPDKYQVALTPDGDASLVIRTELCESHSFRQEDEPAGKSDVGVMIKDPENPEFLAVYQKWMLVEEPLMAARLVATGFNGWPVSQNWTLDGSNITSEWKQVDVGYTLYATDIGEFSAAKFDGTPWYHEDDEGLSKLSYVYGAPQTASGKGVVDASGALDDLIPDEQRIRDAFLAKYDVRVLWAFEPAPAKAE